MADLKDNTRYARLHRKYGSIRKAAQALGMAPSTFYDKLQKERQENRISRLISPVDYRKKSGKQVFVITAAQNDTSVNVGFLNNLKAYANWRGAKLIVIPITYTPPDIRCKDKEWDPSIIEYLRNDHIILHDDLVVCGEFDIRPTAVYPLSGLDSYTKDKWGIFPHSKIALRSVPTPKGQPTKINMTTGCCTVPNYIPKKTGLKAVFHHSYGAVVAEIDYDNDNFWCRHISAADDGSFQDLDVKVRDGEITTGHPVEAMVLGDIHIEKCDAGALQDTYSSIGFLKPKHVILHDLIDFSGRNHHNRNSFIHRYAMSKSELDDVEECFNMAERILNYLASIVDRVIVTHSNHHDSFRRWLEETDFKQDPKNAKFYLQEMQRYMDAVEEAMNHGENYELIDPFVLTMEANCELADNIHFLMADESYIVAGVEVGHHGHMGPNGARGTPNNFSKISTKTIVGHMHSPAIVDGCYVVGTLSKLDMGYNKGPSSWAHANAVVYDNGHRCLLIRGKNGNFFMV